MQQDHNRWVADFFATQWLWSASHVTQVGVSLGSLTSAYTLCLLDEKVPVPIVEKQIPRVSFDSCSEAIKYFIIVILIFVWLFKNENY